MLPGMKHAFTTLACPGWDLDAIIARAREYGYDAVDFRGYRKALRLWELPEFQGAGARDTAKRLADAGLPVSAFSSSALVFTPTPEATEKSLAEVRAYAALCDIFHAPFIRVFGGAIGETPRAEAVRTAAAQFKRMAAVAKDHGIQVLIETHDAWASGHHLRELLEQTASEAAGILWDVHNPYREIGEKPAVTWAAIRRWVRNTHIKDSFPKHGGKPGEFELCLTGAGDVPLRDIMACLRQGGYDGYLTFEWEKHWHPGIAEPESALPAHLWYMRGLLAGLAGG